MSPVTLQTGVGLISEDWDGLHLFLALGALYRSRKGRGELHLGMKP